MSDTNLNPGAGPEKARTVERTANVKTQVVALDIGGAAGPEVLVDGANPMPVSGPLTEAQFRSAPVALAARGAEYWPGYSGSPDTSDQPLNVDPSGALITRGAVTTDEGTFRVNFANTALAVSIGSVTVTGDTVTGTGFLNADVHYKDYFKLDADGESAWVGVASVDSDTQMTLRVPYVGGSSGAASRALVRPVTGSGGAISVASGQATMTTGTTINAITRLVRDMDFAPLVYRARASFSQRIANQSFRVGLTEAFTTTDRWFARFLIDGTTNTTVKCESARNPTTAPSAAETETTTVTIPNGLTTASLLDYRVEQLTESCRFYINNVLVAEHTRSIPSQHDEMEASVGCFNGGTAPASSTTVVVDYITGKNHNKLEIGVMSDAEKIVAATAPLQGFTFTQAGVIAINTVLMTIDCLNFRSVSVQCTSMGTTGQVTVEWSNDGVLFAAGNVAADGGFIAATITAASLRAVNVMARYCRLRMSTATTAGTTTFNVQGSQQTYMPPAQSIAGSVGVNAGTARIGYVAASGVWYDDSSTVLAAAATFTGSSRDVANTVTGTLFNAQAALGKELRGSAESDQSGTLFLEVSNNNTVWRRIKAVPTAAVTGGGQYAEIIHRPSTRYARFGFTNGATLQTRFLLNSMLVAN